MKDKHRVFGAVTALVLGLTGLNAIHAEVGAGDSSRPAGISEADWTGLKAAIGIDGPYELQGELAPPAPGSHTNYFGMTIAVSGNRAVVGAPLENDRQGGAYVFERDTAGRWRQVARLYGISGEKAQFGWSVAMAGETVAVGAPYQDVDGHVDEGKAYVFVRDPATGAWIEQADALKPVGLGEYSNIGYSVALSDTASSGNLLVVGAPFANSALPRVGSAIVFMRTGTTWNVEAYLTPPDAASGDEGFGSSLALSGDRMLVGMPGDDHASFAGRGSAYLFRRSSGWRFERKLEPGLTSEANGQFGYSVALSGHVAAVGQPFYLNRVGIVHTYKYNRIALDWFPISAVQEANGSTGDQLFGWSLALSGSTLTVGAKHHDVTADNDQGAVFIYTANTSGGWDRKAAVTGLAEHDGFGSAVAVGDGQLLAGAYIADAPDADNRGHVRALALTGSEWRETQAPIFAAGDRNEHLGYSVALSGNTAVVTAPNQPDAVGGEGVASVYVRGPSPGEWTWQAALPYPASDSGTTYANTAVAIDANTILIGLPGQKVGANANQGAAYVYVRSGTSWTRQAELLDAAGSADNWLGWSVALSGDTAVLGAPILGNQKGGGLVFARSGTTWRLQQRLTAADGAVRDNLGYSTAISGNTVALGAPGRTGERGGVYVFARTGATWAHQATLVATSGAAGDWFGASVALAGNMLVTGAPYNDGPIADTGSAYVFARAGSTWTLQGTLASPSPSGLFGTAVALAGNTAVVGELGDNSGVHMFQRRGSTWTLRGSAQDAEDSGLGTSVAISGTLVLVGAPYAGPGDGGRAYLLADDLIFANGLQID